VQTIGGEQSYIYTAGGQTTTLPMVRDSQRPSAQPQAIETVDNVSSQDIPDMPSVAWVLGLTKRPGWVLAGDPLGLTLSSLRYQPVPGLRSAATYQGYLTADKRQFTVSEWLIDPHEISNPEVQYFTTLGTPPGGAQDVTVSIDGMQMQGRYAETTGQRTLWGSGATRATGGLVQTSQTIDIDDGALHIRLSAAGLSHDEFMTVIGALVDGQIHPDVAAQLQHELDSAEPSTPH